MRAFLFLLSFLLVAQILPAQDDSLMIRKIADEILQNSKAYENLRVLTKQIGGRLAGSPGMVKAEAWGAKTMKESGAANTWLQECMVPHWVRGGKDEASAEYNNGKKVKKTLDIVALGNSIGTGPKGLKAEVVEVKSFADLEEKKDQVKGKIVFYNYKFNPNFVKTFNAYSDAVKYRGQGPSQAAKYGAVGVIVRSMSHSTDNNPHTGSTRYDSAYPKLPAVAIGLKDADELSTLLKTKPVSVSLKTNGHFLPDTIGHNVIGELKGSTYPDEIITIGGHLDSWDNCEGAHDDGTGCVQTMEILRSLVA
ncbi:MAG TPA: M28 family peptidase, partial [Chitinophagaceae bacterium]|nr:M28 family peptidase [Chitinophagaceae bacterium]